MQENLNIKLHAYIWENNPELLMELEQDNDVTQYISDKVHSLSAFIRKSLKEQPEYIVEDACMDLLTADLKPSRYNYIKNILEAEFESDLKKFEHNGILKTELINMIVYCVEIFESIGFSEANEDNRFIRYVITGAVGEYLESNSEKEKGENELQQSTATEP